MTDRAPLHTMLVVLVLAAGMAGCATPGALRRARAEAQGVVDQGTLLLGARKVTVGRTPFRADCSGFVTACYSKTRVDLVDPRIQSRSGTESIYRTLKQRGRVFKRGARPGDLAFFHNTWDRNGNKRRDDRFTHVALVEKVESDGTVHLLHFASGRVKRDVMNLQHPNQARNPQSRRPWNAYLRRGSGKVLTGQLFFRYGRPLP